VSDVYYLDVWQTAAHYHLTHSIVLGLAPVVVAALRRQRARTGLSVGQQLRQTLGLRKGAGADRLLPEPDTNRRWPPAHREPTPNRRGRPPTARADT